MIAVTIIVLIGAARNTWTCINKKIKKRKQRRTADAQEMQVIIANENENQSRQVLQRDRRSRSFYQFIANRPRR